MLPDCDKEIILTLKQETGLTGHWTLDSTSGSFSGSEEIFHIHGLQDCAEPDLQTVLDLYTLQDREKLVRHLEYPSTDRKFFCESFRLITPAGLHKTVRTKGVYIPGKKKPDRIVGIMTEIPPASDLHGITELRQDLDWFTHHVAHDLKAPLRAVRNASRWLREDLHIPSDSDTGEYLERIEQLSASMSDMLSDLLVFSTINTTEPVSETIESAKMVEEIVFAMKSEKEITLEFESDMPVLICPRRPMFLVWQHILQNAVIHNDKNAVHIRIKCVRKDNVYQFHVADNGPGIPENVRSRIFLPFFKLEKNNPAAGTGMGLAIVKKILQRKQCDIIVTENEKCNSPGTVVMFTWPE